MDPNHMLLKTSPVPDILSDSVMRLDDEIKRVLESTSKSDYDKASSYEQVLHKYLNRVDHMSSRQVQDQVSSKQINTPQQTSMNQDSFEKTVKLEKRVIDSLPKTLQKKGGVLLDHIKDTTELSWNDRGELIVKGEPIIGSNVSDLFHEILRSRKLGHEPKGWSTFANILKDSNIPSELIGNKARWETADETYQIKTPVYKAISTPPDRVKRKQQKGRKSTSTDWLKW